MIEKNFGFFLDFCFPYYPFIWNFFADKRRTKRSLRSWNESFRSGQGWSQIKTALCAIYYLECKPRLGSHLKQSPFAKDGGFYEAFLSFSSGKWLCSVSEYISLTSTAWLRHESPNVTFYGGRANIRWWIFFSLLTWINSFRIQLQKKSSTFEKLNGSKLTQKSLKGHIFIFLATYSLPSLSLLKFSLLKPWFSKNSCFMFYSF